jgi:hypothetical protein
LKIKIKNKNKNKNKKIKTKNKMSKETNCEEKTGDKKVNFSDLFKLSKNYVEAIENLPPRGRENNYVSIGKFENSWTSSLKDLYPQKETPQSCGEAQANLKFHEQKFYEGKKQYDSQRRAEVTNF